MNKQNSQKGTMMMMMVKSQMNKRLKDERKQKLGEK